ncbi:MAG: ribonuclease HII [Spirochaetaceae bacterium]
MITKFCKESCTLCGIDEAGRGPIAGPVTSAAVVLSPHIDFSLLMDSKKLSPPARLKTAGLVIREAQAVGIGWAWPEEIDRVNIHYATLLSMQRAFIEMRKGFDSPVRVLVDGKFTPDIPAPAEAIVKGDARIPEISAASIVAKVARDLWMIRYSRIERKWAFEQHKGYPTKLHLSLCAEHGLSPIHRRSFTIRGI